jgi:hypothetical protein
VSTWRKRPVTVEAVQITRSMGADHWQDLPAWLRTAYENGGVLFLDRGVSVKTLEGWMLGGVGDWIIQGVEGELYPCKASIFAATYEPVTGGAAAMNVTVDAAQDATRMAQHMFEDGEPVFGDTMLSCAADERARIWLERSGLGRQYATAWIRAYRAEEQRLRGEG